MPRRRAGGRPTRPRASLQALLDALDADRREAFVLTQLVGLSYAEAAEVAAARSARSGRGWPGPADLVDAFGGRRDSATTNGLAVAADPSSPE